MNLFDRIAVNFGDYLWSWLVERKFFHRLGRPDRYQLRLYRRWLELRGRVTP